MQKWFSIVTGLLPMILSFIPGMPALLVPVILQGIMEAEALKGASGPDKKAHAMALVTLAITGINSKRQIIDPVKVLPIIDRAIDTGIAIVNLVTRH